MQRLARGGWWGAKVWEDAVLFDSSALSSDVSAIEPNPAPKPYRTSLRVGEAMADFVVAGFMVCLLQKTEGVERGGIDADSGLAGLESVKVRELVQVQDDETHLGQAVCACIGLVRL